ncbi:unnamed protein product [Ambrosiozyma monospora]|uniref:Unnamed protein product n=1 Tax=Ambrosiozyma monospora TaxID=43982 RepID=A0ACB5SUC3_AMBMO|nr:unnamed protein product [Ambrosiozyma monospora]
MESMENFTRAVKEHGNLIIQLASLNDDSSLDAIQFISKLTPELQSQYKVGKVVLGYKYTSFKLVPNLVATATISIACTEESQKVKEFSNRKSIFDSIPNTVEEVLLKPKDLISITPINLPLQVKKLRIMCSVNLLNFLQMNLSGHMLLPEVELETGFLESLNSDSNYNHANELVDGLLIVCHAISRHCYLLITMDGLNVRSHL